ncbi:hypothetical protein [Streptomyces luteireticuli]|uniref:Uncharacterized protein n=1 Tax=Streptomyces luteireticuli TaxID=173858 RepID=A0ABN0Y8P3_9ACTN
MSESDRVKLEALILDLKSRMHSVIDERGPLIQAALRANFKAALEEVEKDRHAFDEVRDILLATGEESSDERVQQLDAGLERVGLTGRELESKIALVHNLAERADGALTIAGEHGIPDGPDPEDSSEFDTTNPGDDPEQEKRTRWRRARKLIGKLFEAFDVVLESLVKVIPVVDPISEIKKALECDLSR